MTRPHIHSAGFTIIELMVTIAVVSVLLGIGVPAFTDTVRNNRMANQTNAVVGALNYARAESATRGMPISICAANAARDACVAAAATATNWTNGWIIFTDRIGVVGQLDGTDEVLQTGPMPAGGFMVSSDATFVRFGVGASGATERMFSILPTNTSVCRTTGTRRIEIGRTGRVSSSKRTC